MEADLNNFETIIVTGGASGIGLATVEVLLSEGVDRCALLDLNALNPEEIERLRDEYGVGRVVSVRCNVSQREDVRDAVNAVAREGRISGLVNCAGTLLAKASLDLTLEDLHQIFDVHLAGSLFTAQAVASIWIRDSEPGAIVNVSSVAANFGWPGRLPYAVVKCGIEALTRTLAVEWARFGIRSNAVSPGSVDSPMMSDDKRPPGIRPLSEVADRHALGRVASAVEIANVIAFLLSSKSSFMTGANVVVDGGFTITKDSAKELAQ